MKSGQPRCVRALRVIVSMMIAGLAVCLFALTLLIGRAPAAHAAGVPYCGRLADEHAPTRSAIHLNRTEGPVGTDLAVSASGWRPGAHVTLHFDARNPKTGELYVFMPRLAQGIVAQDGTVAFSVLDAPQFFCLDMSTPAYTEYKFDQSGGTTAYFVLAADDGEVSAPLAFKYLPAPTVAVNGNGPYSQQVKVGTTIPVTGSGWEPNEPLTINLQSDDPTAPATVPHARETHVTTDAQGSFTTSYPLDARLPWNIGVLVMVEGTGPRFGALIESGYLFLTPAVQPTFRIDHTLVTPGMAITVSGEHWYPGETYTIKYCGAQQGNDGWESGPNCGKAVNPALGTVTADGQGKLQQRFTIPASEPLGVIMVRVNGLGYGVDIQPIAVHVVDHLPTWDDIHPRLAAARNTALASLPVSIPALLLLAGLAFFAIHRWRGRQAAG